MSFKDINSQRQPINILKRYIEEGRLEGSHLFIGPQGVGKKMAAKEAAKAVNCSGGSSEPCDKCPSCIKIENNQHPDVHNIQCPDSETSPTGSAAQLNSERKDSGGIKIEDIRQLQREINLRPYEARIKAFIIDDAHRLTPEAQSALLKVLEEPPLNSLIILLSDKPGLLFKTIISRCRVLRFYPLTRQGLEGILKKDYNLDNERAHFLAYFSEGRLGSALKLKDTDIFTRKNRVIDEFALTDKPGRLEKTALESKEDARIFLDILAAWFRDIYLIKAGSAQQEIINSDRKNDLLKAMSRFSFLDLNEIFASLSDSFAYLGQNINIKLLLYNLGGQICKD